MGRHNCGKVKHYTITDIIKHFESLHREQKIEELFIYDCHKCKAMHVSRKNQAFKFTISIKLKKMEVATQTKPMTLAERKVNTTSDLVKRELELQGLCNNVEDANLLTAIADFKSKWKALQDVRKAFTGHVTDLLITPFIQIEQRVEPGKYAPYNTLVSRELNLRKKAVEIGQFKEHVRSEFERVYSEVKTNMFFEVKNAIQKNLIAGNEGLLKETLQGIAKAPKAYKSFEAKIITKEEKKEIIKNIPLPNYNALVEEVLTQVKDIEVELKASAIQPGPDSERAALFIDEKINEAQQAPSESKAQDEIVKAHVPTVAGPVIKERRVIVVENTRGWVEKIIKGFYECEPAWLMLNSRVKDYSKLTIAQLAEALAKCSDFTVEGVKYEKEEK